MRALNLDDRAAEDALVRLASHVPVGIAIGRPFVAHVDDSGSVTVATDDLALWSLRAEDAAERVTQVGRAWEITVFQHGCELSRQIVVPQE